MKKIATVIFAAMVVAIVSIHSALAETRLPDGAVVYTTPASKTIAFTDGSQYTKIPNSLTVKGAQAMAWFLADTDNPFFRLFKPADLASIAVIPNSETYVFSDGSRLGYLIGMPSATGGLASRYMQAITDYRQSHPK